MDILLEEKVIDQQIGVMDNSLFFTLIVTSSSIYKSE